MTVGKGGASSAQTPSAYAQHAPLTMVNGQWTQGGAPASSAQGGMVSNPASNSAPAGLTAPPAQGAEPWQVASGGAGVTGPSTIPQTGFGGASGDPMTQVQQLLGGGAGAGGGGGVTGVSQDVMRMIMGLLGGQGGQGGGQGGNTAAFGL